jgi:hypothetical protein
MGKLIVVENDKVEGTDKHSLTGPGTLAAPPNTPTPYVGNGSFDYKGKMTDQLSDFVKIDGKPVSLKSSQSSLNAGESASPSGKHSGPMVKQPIPDLTTPIVAVVPSLAIVPPPTGIGNPSTTAGSTFVTVASTAVLLDGDKLDTCGPPPMNATVTAENQSFVSCSE